MIPFLDMEWWCNHAVCVRKCPECGTFAHVLTDVSKHDDESDIEVKCEKCGKTFDVTIYGIFEKIKFLEDDTDA